jgi:hypothetical protein
MTYYKYAEREANSQINWAEVSKGLSDTIGQIDKDRQAKKAAIDASTREAMTELAYSPKGENTTASAWTINYANDMMNYRLSIDRLLKSGKMSLKDYQVAAQNSKDATNLVFTLSKEYQDQYKVIMDRSRTINPATGMPESSRLETDLAALNESFANISNTVPTINSTNGMVYLSNPEVGEDGVQKLGKNFVSLQALRNRVNSKIDAYSLPLGITEAVGQLGENTISQLGKTNFRRTGVVTDITDPTLRNTYTQWEDATIKKIMASDYQLASIMADNMNINPRTGNQYTATYSREEFDADKSGDLILMENQNGSGVIMPTFKQEQRDDAKAYIKSQMSSYIDKKTEKRPFQEPEPQRPQQWEVEAANAAKDQTAAAGAWNQLYTGKTSAEKKAAADILLGTPMAKAEGLLDIDLETKPGSVILTYADTKKSRTIDFVDANNNPISLRDFSGKGVELHGVVDRDKAVKAGGGGKTFGRITDYSGIRSSRAGEAATPSPVAVPLSAITEESGKASSTLQSSLPEGFSVEDMGGWTGNEIKITAPNGKTYEYTSKKSATDAATIKQDLEVFVKTNNVPVDNAPADDAAAKADAAKKRNAPISAPGSFGSATKPRG